MEVLLALFCGFFVNLIKKSLTTRFGKDSEKYFDILWSQTCPI